ncbi:MAG: flagellin lysine-N-methylase [Oscillospiraceae bacterium]|nr:flagellin lysine-N-methylase [Oscillospiraceae bacterium]
MKVFTPNYYGNFKCTADKCPDNCCIGWEIDIDGAACEKYFSLSDDFGKILSENITESEDGGYCFKLSEGDRCPFLNKNMLCDIIINKGEEFLCEICDNHPRFHNCFGNVRETGVGLACIEATRLVLSCEEPMYLVESESGEGSIEVDYDEDFLKELFIVRKSLLEILQDRNKPISERLTELLVKAESIQRSMENTVGENITVSMPKVNCGNDLIGVLKNLEPLNDAWTEKINSLKISEEIMEKSSELMDENPIIIEQTVVYFIFRHFLSSVYDGDILSKAKLSVLFCLAAVWLAVESDSFAKSFIEEVSILSKEIEYSSENMDALAELSRREDCFRTGNLISVL